MQKKGIDLNKKTIYFIYNYYNQMINRQNNISKIN